MIVRSLVAVTAMVLPLAAQARAEVGQKIPDVTFPAFLNGDGRQAMSEFFGQPVMIDIWGRN